MAPIARPQPPRPHEQPSTFAVGTGLNSRCAIPRASSSLIPTTSKSARVLHDRVRVTQQLGCPCPVRVITAQRLGDYRHRGADRQADRGAQPLAVLTGDAERRHEPVELRDRGEHLTGLDLAAQGRLDAGPTSQSLSSSYACASRSAARLWQRIGSADTATPYEGRFSASTVQG